ncbi:inactive peptidyl-prolyl cis-trans isomerase FKBP6-like isoform X1 [Rana temporaria]|uniref:inactive peptidyl-prolyl cis-trans isomerase FKBP6-like isoform X1 n=2 Tax=Rana temporaria TaxID=8407 RepID=UPI001AADCACE|nr:inactive peptidyl-prolyl cis-trans isomerase FKBP6-like isoform X1 [Rana temporaria]
MAGEGGVGDFHSHLCTPRGRDTDGLSVFEKLALNMQDVSGDRGVLKEVIRAGYGDTVPPDSTIIAKYSGYLEHSDKPFDTNWFRRNPRLMKLGEDITLLGMEVGVLTMQKGELSRFLYSPAYAYGALGCPPLIPPSATVLFEVEMMDFLDTAVSDSFFVLSPNHQAIFPLQKVLEIATTERKFGNYLFKRDRFHDAKDRYKRASSSLSRCGKSEEERRQLEAARLPINLNLALTYLRLERPSSSLEWGEKALAIDNKNVKALFRCGQACLELKEYEKARTFLLGAQRLKPFNSEINGELKRLSSCYREYMDQQRALCLRMFAPKSSKTA